ncbi:MAG: hypothetical protein ACRER2_09655 [Methylococcales bacterium]
MRKYSIGGVMAVLLFGVVVLRFLSLQQPLAIEAGGADMGSAELFEALQSHGLLPAQAGSDARILLPAEDYVLAQQAEGRHSPDLTVQQKLLNRLHGRLQGKRVRKQVDLWNLGQHMAAVRDDRAQADDINAWVVSDAVSGRGVASNALLAADFVYVGTRRLRGGFHDWRVSLRNVPWH